jgi:hypothetical protein
VAIQAGSTAQEGQSDRLGRSDCPGRSNRLGGRSDRLGRWRRDASKRRTRVEAKQVAVAGHPSDEENLKTSEFALEGLVSLVLSKGSLVFWVPPYILIE